jgi:hypothetical protein
MPKNIKIGNSGGNEELQSEAFLPHGMIRASLLPITD